MQGLEKLRDEKRSVGIKRLQKEIADLFIDTAGRFLKFDELKNFLANIKLIARRDKDFNFEIDSYMRAGKAVGTRNVSFSTTLLG